MNATNAIVLIIISFGLAFFMGKPIWSDISLLQIEKQQHMDDIDKVRQVEDKKAELLAKLDELSPKDKERIETFLPTVDGVVRLITDIDGIAHKHGISIESVEAEVNRNDSSRSVSEASAPKFYDSKILNLTFSANYTNLSEFLIDLESSLRTIDVRSIDVAGTSSGIPGNVYSYKVGAEIYWLKNI